METGTVTASERLRARWGMDDRVLPRSKAPRTTYAVESKQDVVNAIAAAAGIAAPTLKEGSGVPKSLFVRTVAALGLPVDTTQPTAAIAEDIAYLGDVGWDVLSDSRVVNERNTGCVTIHGLIKVRNAVVAIHRSTRG